MSSPKQTVQSKQLPDLGVVNALSDEGDSENEHDGNQIIARGLDHGSEFTTASCVLPHEIGYCMFPDARESRVVGRSEI